MADASTPFTIGTEVSCSDGICGALTRVIVDPVARDLTHLVVGPAHRHAAGRLVPVRLVDPAAAPLRLRCTMEAFAALPDAEEKHFVHEADTTWGYENGQVLAWPFYASGMGMGEGGAAELSGAGSRTVTRDRVPAGEAEIRRGDPVHAVDGAIGRVQGLLVDPGSHHVTHVLLDKGHLWGRRRVAIPVADVVGASEGVRLDLTKDAVGDLPEAVADRL